MYLEPVFMFSSKEVASIFNTIEEVLSHFIIKESMNGQRMESAAKYLKDSNSALFKKAEEEFGNNMRDTLYSANVEYKMLIVFSDEPPKVIVDKPLFKDSKPSMIVNLPNSLIYGEANPLNDYKTMRELVSWLFSSISSLEGLDLKRVVEFFAQIIIDYNGPEIYTDEIIELAKKMNIYVDNRKNNIIIDETKLGDLIELIIYG